jgi:hypothetical protein
VNGPSGGGLPLSSRARGPCRQPPRPPSDTSQLTLGTLFSITSAFQMEVPLVPTATLSQPILPESSTSQVSILQAPWLLRSSLPSLPRAALSLRRVPEDLFTPDFPSGFPPKETLLECDVSSPHGGLRGPATMCACPTRRPANRGAPFSMDRPPCGTFPGKSAAWQAIEWCLPARRAGDLRRKSLPAGECARADSSCHLFPHSIRSCPVKAQGTADPASTPASHPLGGRSRTPTLPVRSCSAPGAVAIGGTR